MKIFTNLFIFLLCVVHSFFWGKSKKVGGIIGKVLILRQKGHIGDIVYITPLFRAVKDKYPNSQLTFLGAGRAKEVIDYNPFIDEYLEYKGNFSGFFETLKKIKNKNFDFACLANAGSFDGLALLFLAGIPNISTFSTINGQKISSIFYRFLSNFVFNWDLKTGCYIPKQYLTLLDPIKAGDSDGHFNLFFSKSARERIDNILIQNKIKIGEDFIVGIAPGGAVEERWWPAEKFGLLAGELHKNYGAKIILLGAGKDKKAIYALVSKLGAISYVNFLDQSLDEFKATVSICSLVIGNDSGPMVTADAFNIPQLIFVGPTDEREYHHETGPTYKVLKGKNGDINSISLETALNEVKKIISSLKK